MDKSLISIFIICLNRQADLDRALQSVGIQDYRPLELVLVDNGSTVPLTMNIGDVEGITVKHIRSETNLGVAGGRNIAMRACSGKYLVCLDDDAEFVDESVVNKIVKVYDEKPQAAILAFHIFDVPTNKMAYDHIPRGAAGKMEKETYETTYYIGAGHAVRREVLEQVGYYTEQLFFAGEESDLAIRVMDSDYEIWYVPDIKIRHNPSPISRIQGNERLYYNYKNRILFLLRYFPWFLILVNLFTWGAFITFKAKSLKPFKILLDNWDDFIKQSKEVSQCRKRVKNKTLYKMFKLKGHLFA